MELVLLLEYLYFLHVPFHVSYITELTFPYPWLFFWLDFFFYQLCYHLKYFRIQVALSCGRVGVSSSEVNTSVPMLKDQNVSCRSNQLLHASLCQCNTSQSQTVGFFTSVASRGRTCQHSVVKTRLPVTKFSSAGVKAAWVRLALH